MLPNKLTLWCDTPAVPDSLVALRWGVAPVGPTLRPVPILNVGFGVFQGFHARPLVLTGTSVAYGEVARLTSHSLQVAPAGVSETVRTTHRPLLPHLSAGLW